MSVQFLTQRKGRSGRTMGDRLNQIEMFDWTHDASA
jgi:hypothetical protein